MSASYPIEAYPIEALAEATLPAFRALFEESHVPCFCRYWHFTGNKNAWLERCAFTPEASFAETAEAVRAGDPSARGLLAFGEDGEAVGWMKLAPRAALPKLSGLPVYREVAPAPGTTYVVGCFVVRPAMRRHGVARALLEAAPRFARAWGADVLEAYPRRSAVPLHDEEAWQGPEALVRAVGFTVVHDVPPYPVYRLHLASR